MARGVDVVDLSVAEATSFVAAFATGPLAETCVRDAALTETFGLDAEDKRSADAAFFAVNEGLSLVATAAAVAYEQRHAAETRTRDE